MQMIPWSVTSMTSHFNLTWGSQMNWSFAITEYTDYINLVIPRPDML